MRQVTLPCGRCVGCRLERSRQVATRCMHENQMHEVSSFVTLTYDHRFLPLWGSLHYPDFQSFMKRLNYYHNRDHDKSVRFYMCGEYGEEGGRPHYHALLFGCAFKDQRRHKRNKEGQWLFVSETLDRIWGMGQCLIGAVTWQSAAYCARYLMSKTLGNGAEVAYRVVSDDGEVFWIEPEFNQMSLKPGIGATWLDKYARDVYPDGMVSINGVKSKAPRYYDTRLAKTQPDIVEALQEERKIRAREKYEDNTPARLKAREKILKVKVGQLKRPMGDNDVS